jgi:hypothetical protein
VNTKDTKVTKDCWGVFPWIIGLPQALKLDSVSGFTGTTKVVPFPKPDFQELFRDL